MTTTDNKALADRLLGALPAPITNPEAWPPGYADGFNDCSRLAYEEAATALTATPSAHEDLHAHLLHMLGAKDHEDAGRVIARLHALYLTTPSAQAGEVAEKIARKIRARANNPGTEATHGKQYADGLRSAANIAERFANPQPQGDASPVASGGGDEPAWVTALRDEAERSAMKTSFSITRDEMLVLTGSKFAALTPRAHEPAPTADGGAADIPRVIPSEGVALLVRRPAPQADVVRLVEAVRSRFDRCVANMLPADYVTGYREALDHVLTAQPEGATNGQE